MFIFINPFFFLFVAFYDLLQTVIPSDIELKVKSQYFTFDEILQSSVD
jgi:hypothetical protein